MTGAHRKDSWTPALDAPQVFWRAGMWMRTGYARRYDATPIGFYTSRHSERLSRTKRPR